MPPSRTVTSLKFTWLTICPSAVRKLPTLVLGREAARVSYDQMRRTHRMCREEPTSERAAQYVLKGCGEARAFLRTARVAGRMKGAGPAQQTERLEARLTGERAAGAADRGAR